ncbi:MAG: VacJ family lipoprotein [Rhodospirillales bacterium]|nr:VacJ family lipoprotein [Rhodospirillales bacterium]
MTRIASLCRLATTLLTLCLLGGCASTYQGPVVASADGVDEAARPSFIAVDDPWEGMNRNLYAFNALADRWVLLPVVDVYTDVVPWPFRDRISDFFANIGSLTTFANQILQLKFKPAFETAMRFGANSLLGMFGFVDIATPMGLPRYQEDFGQTLGYWGVHGGPYLVLPILGPSNVRDTAGLAADTAAFAVVDPFGASSIQSKYPAIMATDIVNARYIQPFRYFESGSPFEYDLVRFVYTKKRQVESSGVQPLPVTSERSSDP